MCIPDSRYGLMLAWVTSENSTMLLESDILRLFFTGPYLVSSPLCLVSGVDCPSVLPRQLLLFASLLSSLDCPPWSPAATPNSALLWVASSTLIPLPVLLPGTARFQVQESFVWFRAKTDSSALAAYPHSATYILVVNSFGLSDRCSKHFQLIYLLFSRSFVRNFYINMLLLHWNIKGLRLSSLFIALWSSYILYLKYHNYFL